MLKQKQKVISFLWTDIYKLKKNPNVHEKTNGTMIFRSNIKEVFPHLSSFRVFSMVDRLQKQWLWRFPGVALKKCHWISISAEPLASCCHPEGFVCRSLPTKPSSWCAFTTPLFRMRNVKVLHLPLFLLCARVCLGESLLCVHCWWVCWWLLMGHHKTA